MKKSARTFFFLEFLDRARDKWLSAHERVSGTRYVVSGPSLLCSLRSDVRLDRQLVYFLPFR